MDAPEPVFICDITGRKYPRSQMRKMWNGLMVHKDEWEPRQPQDFGQPVRPSTPLRKVRPAYIPD
jgi:hypothetical protein